MERENELGKTDIKCRARLFTLKDHPNMGEKIAESSSVEGKFDFFPAC